MKHAPGVDDDRLPGHGFGAAHRGHDVGAARATPSTWSRLRAHGSDMHAFLCQRASNALSEAAVAGHRRDLRRDLASIPGQWFK
jgi:hypothetical protein